MYNQPQAIVLSPPVGILFLVYECHIFNPGKQARQLCWSRLLPAVETDGVEAGDAIDDVSCVGLFVVVGAVEPFRWRVGTRRRSFQESFYVPSFHSGALDRVIDATTRAVSWLYPQSLPSHGLSARIVVYSSMCTNTLAPIVCRSDATASLAVLRRA